MDTETLRGLPRLFERQDFAVLGDACILRIVGSPDGLVPPRLVREFQLLREARVDGVPRALAAGCTEDGSLHYYELSMAGALQHLPKRIDREADLRIAAAVASVLSDLNDAGIQYGNVGVDSIGLDAGCNPVLFDFSAARRAGQVADDTQTFARFLMARCGGSGIREAPAFAASERTRAFLERVARYRGGDW